MILTGQSEKLSDYLAESNVINFSHPEIIAQARRLKQATHSNKDLVQNTYEFVRDRISHSADIAGKVVTCRASDVLDAGEGICFAKAHLLAALLRCNGIPAGFCYQQMRLDNAHSPIVLHGLNGVYIDSLNRWIRLDARGNKAGVNARFGLDNEMLAFPIRAELDEIDFPFIFSEPDSNVINALTLYTSFNELWANLPRKLAR